jgi:exonuclease III
MRIITWNVRGAKRDSPLWNELSELSPDIALLQEVGDIPGRITDSFELLSRQAISKTGNRQRFSTAVAVNGKIIEEVALSSEHDWVERELQFFRGNFISCRVQPSNHEPLTVVSVYSPAWSIERDRIRNADVSKVKTSLNPDVWGTDILWAALKNTVSHNGLWVVGGDLNSSETYDADWQDRNNKAFSIRSSGNAEMIARMRQLGFIECLRKSNNDNIVPTFRHSTGSIKHQIDHLYVSSDLYSMLGKIRVGDQAIIFGKSLSDHLPIIADFKI